MLYKDSYYKESYEWFIFETKTDVETIRQELSLISLKRTFEGSRAVDFFVPKCYFQKKHATADKISLEEAPMNYVFINTSKIDMMEIRADVPYLDFIKPLNADSGRRSHKTLTDDDINNLRIIADVYNGMLPCYPIDAFGLNYCDTVLVESGPFRGLRGLLFGRRGRNGGQVVLPVNDLFIVSSGEILPSEYSTLEFSINVRHHIFVLEKYIPFIVKALRSRFMVDKLDNEMQSELEDFIRRYRNLNPLKDSIESIFAGLRLMTYTALGDKENAEKWMNICKDILPKIKDVQQKGLHLSMMYSVTGDSKLLKKLTTILKKWESVSEEEKQRFAKMRITIELTSEFERLYNSLKWLKN